MYCEVYLARVEAHGGAGLQDARLVHDSVLIQCMHCSSSRRKRQGKGQGVLRGCRGGCVEPPMHLDAHAYAGGQRGL
jgi:hypothetical protein